MISPGVSSSRGFWFRFAWWIAFQISRDSQSSVIRVASFTCGNFRNASIRKMAFDILCSSDLWLGVTGCRYLKPVVRYIHVFVLPRAIPLINPVMLLKVHIFCTENVALKSMSIFCIHLFNVAGVKEKVVDLKKKKRRAFDNSSSAPSPVYVVILLYFL